MSPSLYIYIYICYAAGCLSFVLCTCRVFTLLKPSFKKNLNLGWVAKVTLVTRLSAFLRSCR
ncbi:hypothetical protein HanRHA438_Chr15g0692561 [Helianthus annuus]|nr:hypothetical protein HanRHA438_Chr15g0692561 [Helianthus annuus]